MRIINACTQLETHFPGGAFTLPRWREYINTVLPGCEDMFLEDAAAYDLDAVCLPVITAALNSPEKIAEVFCSFGTVTRGLEEKITAALGRCPDADIILYLGLCNGAGWVTEINGKVTVLMGIEKIIELDWCSLRDMYGLLYHELGHVYQYRFGTLERETDNTPDAFLWQLYIEGVAMHFEQLLMSDGDYFHQDTDGWKSFLSAHLGELKADFARDILTMPPETQCYFGDWVRWHGRGDAGYYLAAKFMDFIVETLPFNSALSLDLPKLKSLFNAFVS